MRKNPGFTLIELMVVMAIIAILATAGLSAYTGYLRKARDSTRISDIKAIESVVLASLGSTGSSPTMAQLQAALTEMNNGQLLRDPLWTLGGGYKDLCCTDANCSALGDTCQYQYGTCQNTSADGYRLVAMFESASNANKYTSLNSAAGYYINTCGAANVTLEVF